jgi:hypothetical protein
MPADTDPSLCDKLRENAATDLKVCVLDPRSQCLRRSLLLSALVFSVVGATFWFFGPNYQWQANRDSVPYGADFLQEWVGAKLLFSSDASQLYSPLFIQWQHSPKMVGFTWDESQYYPPVYPPPHYAIFTPMSWLSYRWAVVVWLIILIVCSWLSSVFIQQLAIHTAGDVDKGYRTPWIWIAILLFPALFFAITLGQKSPLWLLILSMAVLSCVRRNEFLAGAILGILTVKPTICFLLPMAMVAGQRWRMLAGMLSTTIILWGLSASILPWELWHGFFQTAANPSQYGNHLGYRVDWSCNLFTLANSLPVDWIAWARWGIVFPLGSYILICLMTDRHGWNDPIKWMLVLTSTALLSPHFYHYDLCILLLPIAWLLASEPRRGFAYFACLAVGMVMAEDAQTYLQIPIVPILLIGIVCEIRLHGLSLGKQTDIRPWGLTFFGSLSAR